MAAVASEVGRALIVHDETTSRWLSPRRMLGGQGRKPNGLDGSRQLARAQSVVTSINTVELFGVVCPKTSAT